MMGALAAWRLKCYRNYGFSLCAVAQTPYIRELYGDCCWPFLQGLAYELGLHEGLGNAILMFCQGADMSVHMIVARNTYLGSHELPSVPTKVCSWTSSTGL